MLKSEIKKKVKEIFDELLKIRHHLHSNPELSFEESQTANYISQLLSSWNIAHTTNIGGYGIAGLLKGHDPDSKVIALRADMDALPITEVTSKPYCSKNKGVMHACGHDVHMTCLLGAIKLLSENPSWFKGTIKFIFQPAEETLPGGAIKMIEDGVLEDPTPDCIIGQHVFPDLEVGKVGSRPGPYMASTDELNINVRGRGGHGALPYTFDDTVNSSAEFIYKVKERVKIESPNDFPTVLSFGKVIANGAYNVIPPEVEIKGTFRTFNEKWRKQVHQIILDTAKEVDKKHSTTSEVNIVSGYPVLINNDALATNFKGNAIDYVGNENFVDLDMRTTGEDFARFTQIIPGIFYRLGVANKEKGITSSLHSPTFDVDEKSIETGTGLLIWAAINCKLHS